MIAAVSAWLLGLALAAHARQPPVVWLLLAALGLILLLGSLRRRQTAPRLRLLALALLALGLGAARQSVTQQPPTSADLIYYNDQGPLDLSGVIVDQPDIRDKDIQLRVQIDSLTQGKTTQPVSGLALVLAPPFGSYHYGDRLTIFGAPLTPPIFDTFDYQAYLSDSGVYTLIEQSKISVIASGQGSPLWAALYSFRGQAQQLIESWLPSPQSALLEGIVLGVRTTLPADIRTAFDQTGAARILAIDGAKMAIVIGLLTALFGRIRPRLLSLGLIALAVLGYTLFVGAEVSVVRAAVMGLLAVIALQLGRDYDGLIGLAFALWLQTLIVPQAIQEAALWISASATAGLVIAGGPLRQRMDRWLEARFSVHTVRLFGEVLLESLLVTLIVTVASLPVILLTFGQFAWIGLIVNVLITPAQGLILILGIPAVLIGSVIGPLGQLLADLSALPLGYTLALIRAAAQLPGIDIPVTMTPALAVTAYAILIGLWRWFERPAEARNRGWVALRQMLSTPALLLTGFGVAALLWITALARPDGQLHVWFLDVGGNAVLIESPRGAWVLIDGGQNPTRLLAALGDRLPFNQRDLDTLIVTQGKAATISALPALFSHYRVHTLLSSGPPPGADWQLVSTAAAAQGSAQINVTAGYTLSTDDGLHLTLLSPDHAPDAQTKPDDGALVLRLTYGDVSFLLASELGAAAETELIHTQYLRASVLQLLSHGADAANSADLLKAIDPQLAVIEVDSGNRSAQPAPALLKRLGTLPVYRTDTNGTLSLSSDGAHLSVSTDH